MAVAITFDDGPAAATTPALLSILEELAVPATFFLLGESVAKYPTILQRAAASPVGHQFANHSWSHPNFLTLNNEKIRQEIEKTQDLIASTIGRDRASMWMRPPFGAASQSQITLIEQLGYRPIFWTLDPEDWKADKEPAEIAAYLDHHIADGAIVLLHDVFDQTVNAMQILLPKLKNKFKLTTVENIRTTQAK
jgi:peptidoglycan/xylan/chitin deacetylase (PgdA/CDA1 family)